MRGRFVPRLTDRLGLFGGAFNPIHHGHLIAVQETARQLELERVLFIPTGHPPHKDNPDVDPRDRLEMTRLALEGQNNFEVSPLEVESDGPSYTYETLQHLREEFPESELSFMTGSDELLQFTEWHEWEALLDEFTIVGMTRPGFDEGKVPNTVKERSSFVEIPDVQVSSSMVRERFANGEPVRFFLPRSVWDFITEKGLYR